MLGFTQESAKPQEKVSERLPVTLLFLVGACILIIDACTRQTLADLWIDFLLKETADAEAAANAANISTSPSPASPPPNRV